ncbi:helix-turn-helix transcriptional regulator [Streptomyces lunaelactis]|nr:helix-turn-helix transcriptional regulator [Streptomyces lunaelactis]NUL32037.1 helix-turn-helix transcriptional regulator [Streptomyces lunaelactis]
MMREREWDTAVRGPLASAAPVLVLVEGEAGTGKTRFVQWLLALPELGRAPRLTVNFKASGASIVHDYPPAKGTASAGPEATAARRSGSLQPRALQPKALRPGAPATPSWLAPLAASSLGELASSLGSGAPVLLVAEDVHRADEQVARALRTLLADPPAGLRVVLSYRPEDLARPGLVLGAPVGYPAELPVIRLRLGALGEAEVRRMAVGALGEDRCSAPFLARLHERSGGIAQVVADLLEELKAAAPLPRSGTAKAGQKRFTARDVDEADVPVRLAELVVGRLAALDEEPRRVVWAAAVLDESLSEDDLASVAGLPTGSIRAALMTALSEAVLHEPGPGRYGFRVPMAAAAVYHLIPGPVRRELHGRAAEALASRRPVPWARLAHQQKASGRTADWLESVENAAREAVEAGDYALAIGLLEGTLAHSDVRQPTRARLALMLAQSATRGLHSDKTLEVLRRVVDDRALPAATRGEVRIELGKLLLVVARGNEGRAELRAAVDELSNRPALSARAMSVLGVPYWPGSGPLADNLAWLQRAETAAAGSGDAALQVSVAATRAAVMVCVGDPDGWRCLEQLPRESDDPRILQHSAWGLCCAANAAIWLGEYARARELQAEGMKLYARSEVPFAEQVSRGTSLLLDMETGHWAGLATWARLYVAEAGEVLGATGEAMLVLGLLALAKGELDQVDTWLSGAGLSGDGSPVPRVAAASGGRIRLALAREDLTAAAREAAEAWARLQAASVWVWAAELAPWAVEATVRSGGLDTAQEMVDEFAAGIESRQAPAAAAALMWCRALLAAAHGKLLEAADYFRRARKCYQALPRPYEAALVAEAGGRCALRGGLETTTGLQELSAATHELEALGATWDAARVRAELRAHHSTQLPRPPGRPGYDERLSPREQEVAQLAGDGLSNREIAATLYLSPRTVEQHVARAMRKVGALSRHDLARKVRNGEPEG